jgi:hypothetical protein
VRGNVLTREPRLFRTDAEYRSDKAADVWALAATLFALRTGNYPFANAADVGARRRLNESIREGSISLDDASVRKAEQDRRISEEALKGGAQRKLDRRLDEHFRGKALELMKHALTFDDQARRPASHFAIEWAALANQLSAAEPHPDKESGKATVDLLREAEEFLRRVHARELSVTEKQLQRLVDELNLDATRQEDPRMETIKNLVQQVKRKKLYADQRLKAMN